MVRRYEVFADYFQFYLLDQGRDPDTAADYTTADCERRVKAEPYLVVVMPERNMTVPVEIEVADGPPTIDLDGWDHVTEASLDLPSGRMELRECTGTTLDVIPLAPGCYRLRAHHAGLDTLSEDGLDGEDRYRIVVWPAPPAEVAVLRQYGGVS